jgi:23S rRNA (uracil1939-C5)-methyltransferase
VGREEGKAVFVPFGAPGDAVTPGRREEKKNFSRAWIGSLTTASPDRAEPPCPLFYRPGGDPAAACGGCDWQHLAYPAQVRAKKDLLIEAFQRIGRIPKPAVEDTVRADPGRELRYRNKVQIPLARGADGKIRAGFYAAGSHTVVPFDDCLIQSQRQVAAVRETLAWLNRHPVAVYDAVKDAGWLRHLYLRESAAGEILLALVTRDESFSKAGEFTRHLMDKCPFVKSVFLNVNPRPGNVVLGPRWVKLAGRPYLEEFLLGLRFKLSPGAFFQVNRAQAEKLYSLAVDMAALEGGEHVLELYAGVGAMGMLLSAKARKVWAVEESPQAVKDGIESLGANGVENLRFKIGKCEDVILRGALRAELSGAPVVALLDPPRAGCDPRVLKALLRLAPKRIVYVSCDPATLARDARYLSTGGYRLLRSVPVDLFPQTSHVESVSLFARG